MSAFTYQAYCDVLDAIGEDIRKPRRIGEPPRVSEAIARHQEPTAPAPRIARWETKPDVPAKMERAAAERPQTELA